MPFLLFAIALIYGCVCTYLYFLIKRFLKVFFDCEITHFQKLTIRFLSVAASTAAVIFFGYGIVFVFYMAIFDVAFSFIRLILRKTLWKKREEPKASYRLIKSGVISAVASAVVVVLGIINFHNVVKTEYTVYTDKNIRDEGYKAAFISDVHFGMSLNLEELREVCNEISRENPDIVVLGGDIIDSSTNAGSLEPLFEALGGIRSRYGVFYIFGNHDKPMGEMASWVSKRELSSVIEDAGIEILCDKVFSIGDDFVIAGREDRGFHGAKRQAMEKLLSEVSRDKFILTLDHQPSEYEENNEAGVDLIISGHTHGGQVWPVNIIDNIFKMNEANYGYVEIDEDTSAIVSSGLAGWGFTVKTAAPAEYVIVNIKKR